VVETTNPDLGARSTPERQDDGEEEGAGARDAVDIAPGEVEPTRQFDVKWIDFTDIQRFKIAD
jgi:hypothetical protein